MNTKKRFSAAVIYIGILTSVLYSCRTVGHSDEHNYLNPTKTSLINQSEFNHDTFGDIHFDQKRKCDIIVMRDSSTISCIIVSKTRKELKVVDCPNTGVRTIMLRKNVFSINGKLEIKKKERKTRKQRSEKDHK